MAPPRLEAAAEARRAPAMPAATRAHPAHKHHNTQANHYTRAAHSSPRITILPSRRFAFGRERILHTRR